MSGKYRTPSRVSNGKPNKKRKILKYKSFRDDPWLVELSSSDRKFYKAILNTSEYLSAFSLNGYLFQFKGERP